MEKRNFLMSVGFKVEIKHSFLDRSPKVGMSESPEEKHHTYRFFLTSGLSDFPAIFMHTFHKIKEDCNFPLNFLL